MISKEIPLFHLIGGHFWQKAQNYTVEQILRKKPEIYGPVLCLVRAQSQNLKPKYSTYPRSRGLSGEIGNQGLWFNVGGLIYLVLSMVSIKREQQNQWTMRHWFLCDNIQRKHSTAQSFRVFTKRPGMLSLRLILLYSVSSTHWKPAHKTCRSQNLPLHISTDAN